MMAQTAPPSSLGQMFADMACRRAKATDALEAAIACDDHSEVIRCANAISVRAKSAIARENSVKPHGTAIEEWRQRLGADPIKLFALSLLGEYVLAPRGARRVEAHSRKMALRVLVPNLKPQGDHESITEKRRADELNKLYISFKGMIEKPPAELRRLLRKVRLHMRDLLNSLYP